MKIALFNWRDRCHPKAGGAEEYTHNLLTLLHNYGHECTWIASSAVGLPAQQRESAYDVVRMGNEYSCRLHALRWLRERRTEFDLVIDEVNTLPFLSPLVHGGKRTALLIHQLAREVWWREAPKVIAPFGYALEPLSLSLYKRSPIVTVSESSLQSLRDIGLRGPAVIAENPLQPAITERRAPIKGLIGYVGRLAPSKRVDHIIEAMAVLRRTHPEAHLVAIGGGSTAERRKLEQLSAASNVPVEFKGRVPAADRDDTMASLDCLVMASMREGWGLVVSEAARYGVPTVAYNVAGLRDSISDGETGLLVEPCPDALARGVAELLGDRALRDRLGRNAAERLSRYGIHNFEEKVQSFLRLVQR